MVKEIELSEEAFKEISQRLAEEQRGEPERAMLRIQHSQIAQLYGWVAEHTGDLTERISDNLGFFHGNYNAVKDKVYKVHRTLNHPYGFEKEFREQIVKNVAYYKKEGREKYSSGTEAERELRRLGQKYADEHKKLVVVNEAQRYAREAAIAIGEFHFDKARRLIQRLKDKIDEGPEAWEKYALSRMRAIV